VALQQALDELFEGASERLLALARPQAGQRVLDIGCGAGALSLETAYQVGPSGSVLGIDVSRALLERAEERCRAAGLTSLVFQEADAQVHPFEVAAFDLAISRFGVMFFADPVAAFANLASGLRPGGRMVVAAWSGLAGNPWFEIPRNAAIEVLGAPPPADPHAPGPLAFADAGRVVGLLEHAGLADCEAMTEIVALKTSKDLSEVARLAGNIGPAARILRALEGTPADAERIVERIERGFRPYATDDGFAIPARFNFFAASRPDERTA